ncbi:TetR/AcrR family transcriptional regulator [Microbacterium protaetiae]|uniref:TetR/AcrR family transcriptional regulator n=1 Tax=Microbacterium protaetiae TaxID=2509458 RepID=A0A4P6EET1_9MICO|nr:helix-turn-helix domain-containing protein [Microbacterium protaetiae]QAY60286.1 TetR/AcrR family transcriptional regulator [Microbacterium protaetiae]
MGQHSDRAREALLDAAEELFAKNGIDAVSSRRIAEHAGSANHSAVAYHFGTRDDLLRALIFRHNDVVAARRRELLAELGPHPSVHDIVRCRLLPLVELLDSIPGPSWRAQFLAQLRSVPSAVAVLEESADELDLGTDFSSLATAVEGISPATMRGRSAILGYLVLGVCAEYEAESNSGTARGSWRAVGYFLIDAAAGMLAAPVTRPEGGFDARGHARLV